VFTSHDLRELKPLVNNLLVVIPVNTFELIKFDHSVTNFSLGKEVNEYFSELNYHVHTTL